MTTVGGLVLTKHEAAGNDFLVLVDLDPIGPLDPVLVAALCDRHRGVGADGVLRLRPGRRRGAIRMELWNADGSAAEMSGNGIRCVVQAAVDAGMAAPPEVVVETMNGDRTVSFDPGEDGRDLAAVEMGEVELGQDVTGTLPDPLRHAPARMVSVGNPHLVVVVPDAFDPGAWSVAPMLASSFAGGSNVELISVAPGLGERSIRVRVMERGAGETMACGTGSCAAAAVARALGLCGDEVTVDNPGGALRVVLVGADPTPRARLSGPVRRVARVRVDPSWLRSADVASPTAAVTGRAPAGAASS